MTKVSEQYIQALVSEGNDEQAVRLIYELLDLDQGKTIQRVELLTQLGERYLTLALSRESEIAGQDIEEALKRLDRGSLVFPAETARDLLAQNWYREASKCFSAAIKQAKAPFDCSTALRVARLACALHGEARSVNVITR